MSTRIAAIFAHPDDEVLGCGGSLALHAAQGHEVSTLLLATGLAARQMLSEGDLQELRDQARRAADRLGVRQVSFADFPDNAMDSVPLIEIVRTVETFVAETAPEIVYTHHGGDLNVDHRQTHAAVLTALRPLPGRGPISILGCEINSSTEWAVPPLAPFVPSEFQDIGGALDAKLEALACYSGELRDWPHPRSLEGVRALARWRGTQAGLEAAEAFMTLRRVRDGSSAEAGTS